VERLEDRCTPSTSSLGGTIDLSGLQFTGPAASSDILVAFSSTAVAQGQARALPGTSLLQELPLVPGLFKVGLSQGMSVAQALAAYQATPGVLYADPDNALADSAVPNDPQFGNQWDMSAINAPAAWNATTGSTSVTVAVMDSGIDYTHPDLANNVWVNQAEIPTLPFAPGSGLTGSRKSLLQDENGDRLITFADLNYHAANGSYPDQGLGKITAANGGTTITAADILAPMVTVTINGVLYDTGKGGWAYAGNTQDGDTAHPNDFIGWNFVADTNNPYDDLGHGTHVSGTIGAVGNNGTGIAGINWTVQLMPVKFIDSSGNGYVSNFIEGLSYSIQHGAKISNNSWSGAGYSQALHDAVAAAQSAGQIFVAAAGNQGADIDTSPTYPASLSPGLDNVITVAATDGNNSLASFSNYGPKSVALAAPGVNTLSTLPNAGYGTDSGTSMATPHVTGVAALLWADHPSWTYQEVINQILTTVTPLPSAQDRVKLTTGGLLNAGAALGQASTAPQVVSVSALATASGAVYGVQVTFNRAMNPATINSSSVTERAPGGTVYYPSWSGPVAGSGNQVFQIGFGGMSAPGTYTIMVSPAARDSAGNLLTAYSGTVTVSSTGTTSSPPSQGQVTAAATLQTGTGLAYGIQLTFNRAMNPGTVNSSSVTLTAPNGTVYYPNWVNTVGGSGNTVFQIGFSGMSAQGTYTVRVSSAAQDSNGTPILPFQGSVSFGAPPSQGQVTGAVVLQAGTGPAYGIQLTFNRAMNPGTVNSSSVTLTAPNGTVYYPNWVSTVAGSGNTVFQIGFSGMSAQGTYTVRVSSAAQDSNGTPILPFQGSVSVSGSSAAAGKPQVADAGLLIALVHESQ
jgi:subtilisin family serine protease